MAAIRSSPTKGASGDTNRGVLMGVLVIVAAMGLGAVLHFFWQRHSDKVDREPVAQYLSLGEQAIGIGNHSVLIEFSVEFEGRDTEEALKQVLPALKNQVLNRMARIRTTDLARLRTPQGKRELADDMRTLIQDKLPDEKAGNVKGVLYSKFLIGD